MMALELYRDHTLSTSLMAVSRLSTITPMTMMDSSLMSPTREHPPTLLLPLLLLTLLPPLLPALLPLLLTLWLLPFPTLLPLLLPILLPLLLLTHLLLLWLSLSGVLLPLLLDNSCFQEKIFIIFMKYKFTNK